MFGLFATEAIEHSRPLASRVPCVVAFLWIFQPSCHAEGVEDEAVRIIVNRSQSLEKRARAFSRILELPTDNRRTALSTVAVEGPEDFAFTALIQLIRDPGWEGEFYLTSVLSWSSFLKEGILRELNNHRSSEESTKKACAIARNVVSGELLQVDGRQNACIGGISASFLAQHCEKEDITLLETAVKRNPNCVALWLSIAHRNECTPVATEMAATVWKDEQSDPVLRAAAAVASRTEEGASYAVEAIEKFLAMYAGAPIEDIVTRPGGSTTPSARRVEFMDDLRFLGMLKFLGDRGKELALAHLQSRNADVRHVCGLVLATQWPEALSMSDFEVRYASEYLKYKEVASAIISDGHRNRRIMMRLGDELFGSGVINALYGW